LLNYYLRLFKTVLSFFSLERLLFEVKLCLLKLIFRSLPENRKKKAFYICWTRKEAFLKATGDGLVQSLDKFDAGLLPGEPTRLLRMAEESKKESRWSIQNLKPAPHYVGALAVKSHLLETKRWQWEVA